MGFTKEFSIVVEIIIKILLLKRQKISIRVYLQHNRNHCTLWIAYARERKIEEEEEEEGKKEAILSSGDPCH